MRNSATTLMAAALALSAWTGAHAATLVLGGLAGRCSELAKMGRSDPDSVDICSRALASEALNAHDRAGTLVNRGAMELQQKRYELAHRDFSQALAILPALGEAHVGEAAYLISQQRFPDAEAEVTQGLALKPEEPEKAYYIRALARWGQDDFKGAYLDFKMASQLKPSWDLPKKQLTNFHVRPAG